MASSIPADLVDEVYKRAMRLIPDMAKEITQRLIREDGTTFGDTDLNRGERIMRFQDYAQRGVLDVLQTIKPDLYERLVDQNIEDMQNSPFVRREAPAPSMNGNTPRGY